MPVTSIKFTKQESVSEWVSHWQAFPMIGLGSDKNCQETLALFNIHIYKAVVLQEIIWAIILHGEGRVLI